MKRSRTVLTWRSAALYVLVLVLGACTSGLPPERTDAGGTGGSKASGGDGSGGRNDSGGRSSGGTGGDGGESGGSGSGGRSAGGAGGTRSVATETFDDGRVPSGWRVDNSKPHEGEFSAHPPALGVDESASMHFDCGGNEHSELSFFFTGWGPPEGQKLNFYVDDRLYRTYGSTQYLGGSWAWQEVDIVVPTEPHEYRWEVTSDVAGQPPFWVDTIRCVLTPSTDNTTGRFDYEERFVPEEVTGAFVIDNSLVQDGKFSTHPPLLDVDGEASLSFACDDEVHSQLTFFINGSGPREKQQLLFYMDEILYQTYGATRYLGGSWAWQEVSIVVPTGTHAYRWKAVTDVAGQPPFWIDSMRCSNTAVADNGNGRFDFEEKFVPEEMSGEFVIDNSLVHEGAFAAHPPLLPADGTASLSFDCDDASHSRLTFFYNGSGPGAGQQLRFYVDGDLYQTYDATQYLGGGYAWEEVTIAVAAGTHEYRWTATTDVAGRPPYWLDSIRCQ